MRFVRLDKFGHVKCYNEYKTRNMEEEICPKGYSHYSTIMLEQVGDIVY